MSDDEESAGRAARKSARDYCKEKKVDEAYSFPLTESGRGERRVTVERFKGKVRVDIREYYLNESGEMAPGKRGLSLDAGQWRKLMSFAELIDEAVDKLS
jgi:hypothetical protein